MILCRKKRFEIIQRVYIVKIKLKIEIGEQFGIVYKQLKDVNFFENNVLVLQKIYKDFLVFFYLNVLKLEKL